MSTHFVKVLWNARHLWYQLTRREIQSRYRGSFLGMAWSILQPLLVLVVYAFVFSVVFKARWSGEGEDSKGRFAVILYSGLVAFNIFSDCLTRAPQLVAANGNFVKKVIFPLEILPLVTLSAVLFHACINALVLMAFYLPIMGWPPVTALAAPLALIPVIFMTLGMSWALAAVGVYFRDLQHMMGTLITMFLFLTPIFYPVHALPPWAAKWIWLNPMALAVEQFRNLLIFGKAPEMIPFLILLGSSLSLAALGFALFVKMKKGFADVL